LPDVVPLLLLLLLLLLVLLLLLHRLTEIMFEKFQVPSLFVGKQPVLTTYVYNVDLHVLHSLSRA
jgi:actin-related protein